MGSAQVLMAAIDGGGTIPPTLGVAADLVRRGHRVRVLADPTVETSARAAGCAFTPWTTAPHFDTLADQTAVIRAAERGNPRERWRAGRTFLGSRATRTYADELLAAVRAHPTDGVIVEAVLPGLVIGAEASGLPSIGLMANIYLRPTRDLPVPMSPLTPGRGRVGRLRDAAAWGAVSLATRGLARPINRVRADYRLSPVPELFGQLDRLDRVLIMSSPGFEFPLELPPNTRHVGPQLDDPAWTGDGEDWRPEGDGPLVLVSLSSVYQHQTGVLTRIAEALQALGVRAVITTGRAVAPESVPGSARVRVVRAAPHREVLRETAAVVTHAGHGTVLKTLAAGVPLVCIPMGRDQGANTVRVLRLGAGVRVSKADSAQRISRAIRQVLDDPAFTAAAQGAARMLAAEAATLPNAADEVEAALRAAPASEA